MSVIVSPPKGYGDEPQDLPVGSPYWRVTGYNGYWAVEARRVGETGGTDHLSPIPTRKLATAVAGELNAAYCRGRHDRVHAPEPETVGCRDRTDCPGWQAS